MSIFEGDVLVKNVYVKCKTNYSLSAEIHMLFDFNIVHINDWCLEVELLRNKRPFYIVRDSLLKSLNIPQGQVPSYKLLGFILKKWNLVSSNGEQVIKIRRDAGIRNAGLYSIDIVSPIGKLIVLGLLDDVIELQNICEGICDSKEYKNIYMSALSFSAYEKLGCSHMSTEDLKNLSVGDAILINELFDVSKVEIF